MNFLYNDYEINYELIGQGSYIVLLHGWGVDKETFRGVITKLKDYYQVLSFDFIGFGKSSPPKAPFTLDDYVLSLEALLKYLHIKNPIIVGHSFGGRVALKFSLRNHIKKLVLVSSAGIKHFSWIKVLKIGKYKFLKRWYYLFSKQKYEALIYNSGSPDYKCLSGVMKKTMSNVISENLKKYLKKISVPTLIMWGYHDQVTPYTDAQIFKDNIKKSKLITFFKSGHFCYIDEKKKFVDAIINGGGKGE